MKIPYRWVSGIEAINGSFVIVRGQVQLDFFLCQAGNV